MKVHFTALIQNLISNYGEVIKLSLRYLKVYPVKSTTDVGVGLLYFDRQQSPQKSDISPISPRINPQTSTLFGLHRS